MKVIEITAHQITVPYHDWIAYPLNHYNGPSRRTVYQLRTDTGLVGLGEKGGAPEPEEIAEQYIGTNPFDWMGDETSLGLGTAMYDLMGQAAGVPVYKLFGQQYRSWVPVASWTVSTHPTHMAEAVRQYAAQGYTWLKYHLSPFENVFDQTEAMQEVAPPGFKIHYDFTGGGTDDHMPDLLERLAGYPIAGCFEDPIHEGDTLGSIELRRRINLPIVRHRAPLEVTYEALMGAGDAYIRGHQKIGAVVRCAGLLAAGNIPFSLQNVGGTITRTMAAHMMAAFPTATLHANSDAETWSRDVVKERLEPVNGFVRVPEKPGLGLTLDEAELAQLEKLQLPPQDPWIIKSRFANGTLMYHANKGGHFMVRPNWTRGLVPMSYAAPIQTEYWDDDGSPAFCAMVQRLEREDMILEKE
jgi:L-alanine-DL-glutamate epimerase-like enolase superfamily enzyme